MHEGRLYRVERTMLCDGLRKYSSERCSDCRAHNIVDMWAAKSSARDESEVR